MPSSIHIKCFRLVIRENEYWFDSNGVSFVFLFGLTTFVASSKQSQLDDKDRTIRIQQNLISKLEAEMGQASNGKTRTQAEQFIDTVNMATQTDRVSVNVLLHIEDVN